MVGFAPKLTDAELITLAVISALLGYDPDPPSVPEVGDPERHALDQLRQVVRGPGGSVGDAGLRRFVIWAFQRSRVQPRACSARG